MKIGTISWGARPCSSNISGKKSVYSWGQTDKQILFLKKVRDELRCVLIRRVRGELEKAEAEEALRKDLGRLKTLFSQIQILIKKPRSQTDQWTDTYGWTDILTVPFVKKTTETEESLPLAVSLPSNGQN